MDKFFSVIVVFSISFLVSCGGSKSDDNELEEQPSIIGQVPAVGVPTLSFDFDDLGDYRGFIEVEASDEKSAPEVTCSIAESTVALINNTGNIFTGSFLASTEGQAQLSCSATDTDGNVATASTLVDIQLRPSPESIARDACGMDGNLDTTNKANGLVDIGVCSTILENSNDDEVFFSRIGYTETFTEKAIAFNKRPYSVYNDKNYIQRIVAYDDHLNPFSFAPLPFSVETITRSQLEAIESGETFNFNHIKALVIENLSTGNIERKIHGRLFLEMLLSSEHNERCKSTSPQPQNVLSGRFNTTPNGYEFDIAQVLENIEVIRTSETHTLNCMQEVLDLRGQLTFNDFNLRGSVLVEYYAVYDTAPSIIINSVNFTEPLSENSFQNKGEICANITIDANDSLEVESKNVTLNTVSDSMAPIAMSENENGLFCSDLSNYSDETIFIRVVATNVADETNIVDSDSFKIIYEAVEASNTVKNNNAIGI